MNTTRLSAIAALALLASACGGQDTPASQPVASSAQTQEQTISPFWKNAIVYFAMTDRFSNGNTSNDFPLGRKDDGSLLRGFHGGDIQGLTNKIKSGYFTDLGVQVLWMTPLVENIHGPWVDEWGTTYAYHGYWPKDWSAVDPNFGTEAELAEMIETAHQHGLKVLMDIVINHVGPPTAKDQSWPESWVRTSPTCDWQNFEGVVNCNMVPSLPDVITETRKDVELPATLTEQWRAEGRYQQEMAELDSFFARTQYPKAPQYYIIKWATDWVREYGVDGFRIDTAKHVQPDVWRDLKQEAELALGHWRQSQGINNDTALPFYMVGEVMNWGALNFSNATGDGRDYDYGDRQVDFFDYGFDALINMGFAEHANKGYSELFKEYDQQLHGVAMNTKGIVNYITSHDDMNPFDKGRERTFESANKLLLAPGAVQITWGDEIARNLTVPEARGDEWLRTPMDWSQSNFDDKAVLLKHWQKLGQFRASHPAIGAGRHKEIESPWFVFSRVLETPALYDAVVVAMELPTGHKSIPVSNVFPDGAKVIDRYSGTQTIVKQGFVELDSHHNLALLEML